MAIYDVVVLGLGAMGSSSVYFCAKSGARVLGLEQYSRCHTLGSSHGQSRLIRKAYFEHPNYVPLLEQSYLLWQELEKESQCQLFHPTSLVIFGGPQSKVLNGIRFSSEKYQIPTKEYSHAECLEHFSQFKLPAGFSGIEEKTGGFLEVEKCVDTYLSQAQKWNADLHFEEKVLSWRKSSGTIILETNKGSYETKKLIITAGPWSSEWMKLKLKVHRAPQLWFEAPATFSEKANFPCFAYDMPSGFFYGFPVHNEWGLKVALHKPGALVPNPSEPDRKVAPEEGEAVQEFLATAFPELNSKIKQSALCLYTMTPDGHFILDHLNQDSDIAVAAGFSGHGYKFAPVIGLAMADLVGLNLSKYKPLKYIDFLRIRPEVS